MRVAVLVLVLVNLVLFGYARLDHAAQSEAGRLGEQVQPERIRPLSPQQVASLALSKGTSAPGVCAEWGPFAEAERLRAQRDLEPLASGRALGTRPVGADTAYWVNLGAMPARAAADRRAAELRAQAVTDLSVVDYPRGQFTVSLGLFRTQAAAEARAEALAARGVLGTRVEPRPTSATQTMIVVRDPADALVVRMKELQAQYSGTDVKIGACASSS